MWRITKVQTSIKWGESNTGPIFQMGEIKGSTSKINFEINKWNNHSLPTTIGDNVSSDGEVHTIFSSSDTIRSVLGQGHFKGRSNRGTKVKSHGVNAGEIVTSRSVEFGEPVVFGFSGDNTNPAVGSIDGVGEGSSVRFTVVSTEKVDVTDKSFTG